MIFSLSLELQVCSDFLFSILKMPFGYVLASIISAAAFAVCDCYAFGSNASVFSLEIFKVCLGVVFFVFILLRFCSISQICALMSFIGSGNFSGSISSEIVLSIFPSPSVTLTEPETPTHIKLG